MSHPQNDGKVEDSGGDEDEHSWDRGWDGHELAQLHRKSRLSLAQKLEWLEQAHRVVLHMQKSRPESGVAPGAPSQTVIEE